MRNKLEHILLSLLLGTTVLLGLSFWLNTRFGFNIFYKAHWDELAKLQATHTPINPFFYVYIGIAIFIFLIGIIAIYAPLIRNKTGKKTVNNVIQNIPTIKSEPEAIGESGIPLSRPPHLNLPKNISEIALKQYNQKSKAPETNGTDTKYDTELAQIFSENGYTVKPNPKISGFTPNLFAIGNGEIAWIGGVNCDLNVLQNAVQKLKSVFHETLEDIEINVAPFIIDTLQKYESSDEILVVHSIDDLKKFISENPATPITEDDQDNFNAYSEYIDTIIQYIKNL